MFTFIHVPLDERAVLFRAGVPAHALGPGRHFVFGVAPVVKRWSVTSLVFDTSAEARAVMPADWFGEVSLASHERAFLSLDGRPVLFLRPGTHRYWKADPSIAIEVVSVRDPMPAMSAERAAVTPSSEYVDVTVREHEKGLEYVSGRLTRTLGPGRYTLWSTPEARTEVQTVDLRVTQLTLAGQELMTRDKVTLRLTLTVEYAVVDPVLATQSVANLRDAVYSVVQLASRDYVASVSLDELLAGRDAMTRHLMDDAAPRAQALGVRVERVGVKDVVLPGEMKTLLNKVIEAEKEAAANVILRREETAATRSLANTAKVLADNPVLLRLKELESLKEIASRVSALYVGVGASGASGASGMELLPHGLLGGKAKG